MRPFAREASRWLVTAWLAGCGGGGEAARSPLRETPEKPGSSHAESSEETRPAAPAPPRPRCTDSSCFPCGAGLCPSGFYCDEGAKGGAACSWLPACAKSASCDCVARALGGSRCDMESGGAHVRAE